MMMDTNKKFMYFSGSTSADAGTISPVSCLTAIETRTTNSMHFYFKESLETDTLDIEVTRPTNSDPRDVMEHIVNEINFSKDAFLVVADDIESEYIHPDLTDVVSHTDGSGTKITFTKPFVVDVADANDPGAGFSATGYTSNTGVTGLIQGEVITTLFIELSGKTAVSTADRTIGIDGSSNPAFITQITTDKNGIVYRGEMICVEAGTGSGSVSNVIDLVANTSGSIAPGADASSSGTKLIDQGGTFTLAEMRTFDSSTISTSTDSGGDTTTILNPAGTIPVNGIQDQYLYLAVASSSTAGTYTSGKYIIRLYGAPTAHLSDIE